MGHFVKTGQNAKIIILLHELTISSLMPLRGVDVIRFDAERL